MVGLASACQDGEVGVAAEGAVEPAEDARHRVGRGPLVLQPAGADLGVGLALEAARLPVALAEGLLEDEWAGPATAPAALRELHATFGGHANLAVLSRDGQAHHYAGNDENPVFTFSLGAVRLACTGMYSLDRSVFKFVVPNATNRRIVPREQVASLELGSP